MDNYSWFVIQHYLNLQWSGRGNYYRRRRESEQKADTNDEIDVIRKLLFLNIYFDWESVSQVARVSFHAMTPMAIPRTSPAYFPTKYSLLTQLSLVAGSKGREKKLEPRRKMMKQTERETRKKERNPNPVYIVLLQKIPIVVRLFFFSTYFFFLLLPFM